MRTYLQASCQGQKALVVSNGAIDQGEAVPLRTIEVQRAPGSGDGVTGTGKRHRPKRAFIADKREGARQRVRGNRHGARQLAPCR
jgi:hypothetical protein